MGAIHAIAIEIRVEADVGTVARQVERRVIVLVPGLCNLISVPLSNFAET
jgi:hypothetical protein